MKLSYLYLEAFTAVTKEGHFTLASKRLGLTQSALSQRIINLENELEKTLFIRSKSGIRLTEDGEKLLHYCRQIDLLEDEFLGDFKNQTNINSQLQGHIRIAGFSSIMRSMALKAITPLFNSNPELKLTFISNEIRHLPSLFLQGEVDYLLLNYEWKKENINTLYLGEEKNVLVQKKGYKGPEIYLDHDEHDPSTKKYLKLTDKNSSKLNRRYLDDVYGLLDGVKLGLGKAILPLHLVENDKNLEILHPDKILKIPIFLHYQKQSYYTKLQEEIVFAIKEYFGI